MTKTRVGSQVAALMIALATTALTAPASIAGGPTKAESGIHHPGGDTTRDSSGGPQKFGCFDPNLRQPKEDELHVSPPCGPVGTKVVVSDSDGTYAGLEPGDRVTVYMSDTEAGDDTNLGTVTLEAGGEGRMKFSKEFAIPSPKTPPSSYPHDYYIMVATPGGWTSGGTLFRLTK